MREFDILLQRLLHDERGLATVEYALAGALVAVALVASFSNLGAAIATRISAMTAAIS